MLLVACGPTYNEPEAGSSSSGEENGPLPFDPTDESATAPCVTAEDSAPNGRFFDGGELAYVIDMPASAQHALSCGPANGCDLPDGGIFYRVEFRPPLEIDDSGFLSGDSDVTPYACENGRLMAQPGLGAVGVGITQRDRNCLVGSLDIDEDEVEVAAARCP